VEGKLELTSLQRLTHGNAQPATHIEADPRPGAGEIRQQLGQAIGGEVLGDAEANDAVAGWARQAVTRLLLERQDPARVGEKALALLGRRRLPAVPVQQGIAQALFQAFDLLAHSGLRAVDASARARNPAGVDNGNEA